MKFKEYKSFDLAAINKEILKLWNEENTFVEGLELRKNEQPFIFYEGPPSANGMPGIHHVISRTIKDIICRFKSQQGFLVERKAGWDTHGLPVELSVEKSLGISKEDIGSKISVKEYNDTCKKQVMKYTSEWESLTELMGYWVNMNDPYITYDNKYIETLWYLLKQFYDKGYLYKGYTIQPYSPAAGTGLSSHELNQPGAYRDVKDTTCIAQFKLVNNEAFNKRFSEVNEDVHILAWTTTPWTLPSNTALAVGGNIMYVLVKTFNPYTYDPVNVLISKDRFSAYFSPKHEDLDLKDYEPGNNVIPFKVINEFSGKELVGLAYEQLIDWIKPNGKAFEVIQGDFVTTEDGTGIVHIAPTFGADDYRVAAQNGIGGLLVKDKMGNELPLVDKQGRFIPIEEIDEGFQKSNVNFETYQDFQGRYVKNAYDENLTEKDITVDVDISVILKKENKAFKIEKHTHNYPHCWRTDKPVLYYPLDSWFIKTTAVRDELIAKNKTINWKPESTGTGRFGKWLENLVDWNLSRSRYWGTPLPIWVTEDKTEQRCIGSVLELKEAIAEAVKAGFMENNPLEAYNTDDYSKDNYESFDLHRPFVDEIVLVSSDGKKMFREPDLIDVWFDSGAMPYAQVHYPFSISHEDFELKYPADFVAEGVDQTRGWFFTLHTIAVMLFDSVAYKNIMSNGLVLDKQGNKMSKRLGNAADPFETINKFGSDPLRWYMITNAQPWDNLKFDSEGVEEVKRKFFGTLYNTYSFFALYANIDGFDNSQDDIPVEERPEIDRWIMSLLNSLIKEATEHYNNYEPTKAGRAIQEFVLENLSNWYVRLNRKRFWGGAFDKDKLAAYQTLFTCLETISMLAAPIAPFYTDQLFRNLNEVAKRHEVKSIHHVLFPKVNEALIVKKLEERMLIAQRISSMVLSLRRKVSIKVRQPLQKIMVPSLGSDFKDQLALVEQLILSEVNVKELEIISNSDGILVKQIKANFKVLGPKHGKLMKALAAEISAFTPDQIADIEQGNQVFVNVNNEEINIGSEDVEITSQDIPGWLVTNDRNLTVALDVTITEDLKSEGIARELVNRIQNIRKESGFEVTDKITVQIKRNNSIDSAVEEFKSYIGSQTLASDVFLTEKIEDGEVINIDESTNVELKVIRNG